MESCDGRSRSVRESATGLIQSTSARGGGEGAAGCSDISIVRRSCGDPRVQRRRRGARHAGSRARVAPCDRDSERNRHCHPRVQRVGAGAAEECHRLGVETVSRSRSARKAGHRHWGLHRRLRRHPGTSGVAPRVECDGSGGARRAATRFGSARRLRTGRPTRESSAPGRARDHGLAPCQRRGC